MPDVNEPICSKKHLEPCSFSFVAHCNSWICFIALPFIIHKIRQHLLYFFPS